MPFFGRLRTRPLAVRRAYADPMGLRLKFNLMVVPMVALVLGLVVWADQRHEFTAIMESHAMHSAAIGAIVSGPIDPAMLPETIAGRSLRAHLAYGLLLLALVIASVNGALHLFVLRPLDRMRVRLDRIEHGHWQEAAPTLAGTDEMSRFAEDVEVLGPEIGALVGQTVHADRLAVAALLSRHLSTRLEPEIQMIVQVACDLSSQENAGKQAAGVTLARSAASMLATTRGLDRLFAPKSGSRKLGRDRVLPGRA